MIDERANINLVDNERYPNMLWTTVRDVLSMHQISNDVISK